MLAARRGKIVFHEAYGPLTADVGSPPLQKDSIFSTGSLGKTTTSTAIMLLVEDGLLGLNRPIKEYLPEICGTGTDDIEVQHLLTHTSGFSDADAGERVAQRISSMFHLEGDPTAGLERMPAKGGALALPLKRRRPVRLAGPDVANHREGAIGSILMAPLLDAGVATGVVVFDRARARPFVSEDEQVALAVADEIITKDELDAIDRECDEAIEAITRLKQIAHLER